MRGYGQLQGTRQFTPSWLSSGFELSRVHGPKPASAAATAALLRLLVKKGNKGRGARTASFSSSASSASP